MVRQISRILMLRNRLSRRKRYLILVLFLFVSTVILFTLRREEGKCDIINKYERGMSLPLLFNNSNCKIPDISPRETCVEPLITRVDLLEDCANEYYDWTYVAGKSIVLNTTAIHESGYAYESIKCCYRIIYRKVQEENNYNEDADNVVKYSDDCFPMVEVVQPFEGEFFMVICKVQFWTGISRNVYRDYHWIPSLANSNETVLKHNHWNSNSDNIAEIPPNVIIIGIDSTSRVNFHRQMGETKRTLEELEAVEMLGYTKVGDNTFPNFAAMLTGYSMEELERICQEKSWLTKQDDCPYIWKRFSQANYFTSQIEDGPFYTGFNYKKTGFVKQPVDFYLRPLLLAAHEYAPTILNQLNLVTIDHIDCMGHKTNDETIVDAIKQVIGESTTAKVPLYLHSWSTVLAHDDFNYISLVDTLYSNLLRHLNITGQLRNTVLVLLSDHGYRFGKIRETFSGWYEEKLPVLWLYLSPDIREKFPDWQKNLQSNSRRLVSTYHLYWTFNQILHNFTNVDHPENEKDHSSGEIISRRYKNSLLNPVPDDWTCDDVGVTQIYCACYPRQFVDIKHELVIGAAEAALTYVNSFLPLDICARLRLKEILSGDKMNKTSDKNNQRITYVISFVTDPGDFVLEAYVDYYAEIKSFDKNSTFVQRTSKINTNTNCVKHPRLELFCYCNWNMFSKIYKTLSLML